MNIVPTDRAEKVWVILRAGAPVELRKSKQTYITRWKPTIQDGSLDLIYLNYVPTDFVFHSCSSAIVIQLSF